MPLLPYIDGFEVYLEASQVHANIVYLILLGFSVGLVSGLLGVGGGWLLTPVLNVLGLPMMMAVGTSLLHISAASFVSLFKHQSQNNIDFRLALSLAPFMVAGVFLGKILLTGLQNFLDVDSFISAIYFILLTGMGILLISEFFPLFRAERVSKIFEGLRFRKGPKLYLKHSQKSVFWVEIGLLGGVIGLVASLGAGGGFILVPALSFVVGLTTINAIGTSLVCVFISAISGAAVYASSFLVDWQAFGFLFAGAFFGSLFGVSATRFVEARLLRVIFASLVNFAAIALILKQLELRSAALSLILLSLVFISSVSLFLFLKGLLGTRKSP